MSPPNSQRTFSSSFARWFFAASILFVLYLAYHLVEPFLVPIFLGVVLVVVASPLYNFIRRLLGGRSRLASAITSLLLMVIIILPLFFIVGVITTQAFELSTTVTKLLGGEQLSDTFAQGLGKLAPQLERLQHTLGISQGEIVQYMGQLVQKVSGLIYSNLTGLIKGVTSLVVSFALLIFVTFYLLSDGKAMADRALSLSPLPAEMNQGIRDDMMVSLRGILRGTVVLALLHGLAGGLGFWIFGVPKALFWGTVMVFASVVPLVGTALVWVPAGIYLSATGPLGQAIGMMVWCLLALLALEYLLRPHLIGGQSKLHPLLTFFAVLGGLNYFGLVGLILGPLVLAVLLSLLEVYEHHVLNPLPMEASPGPAPLSKEVLPPDSPTS